jgi:GH25 family lysozyme M1 (1,4-beta-N-acetylmuramidase)
MTEYIQGIDVSHHQGVMDWQKAYDRGTRFAFIRAGSIDNTEGYCYTDYQFERNSEIAPIYMPCGYYWYFRPNYDAFRQADYFTDLLLNKSRQLPAVDDAEALATQMSMAHVEKAHKQFCEAMDVNLDDETMIYSNMGYWGWPNIYARAGIPSWATKRSLWVANFTNALNPLLPVTWSDWLFWQWSADGNMKGAEYGASGSHSIDLNRFNGDWSDFRAYIDADVDEPEPPEPPEPPEDPPHEIFLPYVVRVNASKGLFTRKTPEIADNKAGALFNGTLTTVVEEQGDWRLCQSTYWSHGDYLVEV